MSETVQVKTLADRKVLLRESVSYAAEARLSIEDVGIARVADEEQFAYVKKEDLLDALARFGWLPKEYLKPDPREAKIQEIVLHLLNTDRTTYDLGDPYDTYAEAKAGDTSLTPYRKNAEALIDAGLVTVDE